MNLAKWSRRWLGAIVLSLLAAAASAQSDGGPVVLTVVIDGQDEQSFTVSDLREIGEDSFETSTIWTEGIQVFVGTPVFAFLTHLGVTEGEVVAMAINDYAITIPVDEALQEGPLIAYLRNGEPMSVREKGPLWIVYPYDRSDAFQTEIAHARSIWQLDRIEIRSE